MHSRAQRHAWQSLEREFRRDSANAEPDSAGWKIARRSFSREWLGRVCGATCPLQRPGSVAVPSTQNSRRRQPERLWPRLGNLDSEHRRRMRPPMLHPHPHPLCSRNLSAITSASLIAFNNGCITATRPVEPPSAKIGRPNLTHSAFNNSNRSVASSYARTASSEAPTPPRLHETFGIRTRQG